MWKAIVCLGAALASLPVEGATEPGTPHLVAIVHPDAATAYLDQVGPVGEPVAGMGGATGSSSIVLVVGPANTLSQSAAGAVQSAAVLQWGRANRGGQDQTGFADRAELAQIAPGAPGGADENQTLDMRMVEMLDRPGAGPGPVKGNLGLQLQAGIDLRARLVQVGWENDGDQFQVGNGHRMAAVQIGSYNTAALDQVGADETLSLTQIGADNAAVIAQSTSGNVAEVRQTGQGNVASVRQ